MFKLYYLAHFKVAYKIIKHHSILINIEGCTTETTDPTPFLVIFKLQFENYKTKTKLQALDGQRNENSYYQNRGGSSDFRLPTSDFRLPTPYFRLQT